MTEVNYIFCNTCGAKKNMLPDVRAQGTAFMEIHTNTNIGLIHFCIPCWKKFVCTLKFREEK